MAARKSNPQFIADLMRYASAGPLMQAFVIEALDRYAADVLATEKPANAENALVSWSAWYACAAETAQALADRRA
jgi:hypothetical protein